MRCVEFCANAITAFVYLSLNSNAILHQFMLYGWTCVRHIVFRDARSSQHNSIYFHYANQFVSDVPTRMFCRNTQYTDNTAVSSTKHTHHLACSRPEQNSIDEC